MADVDEQIRDQQKQRKDSSRVGLASSGGFDKDLYGDNAASGGNYVTALPTAAEEAAMEEASDDVAHRGGGSHPATRAAAERKGAVDAERDIDDPIAAMRETHGSGLVNTRIADREDEYQQRRRKRLISPERGDAFSGVTPARSYADIMREKMLQNEEKTIHQAIRKKKEEEAEAGPKKRRRWDAGETEEKKKSKGGWGETPGRTPAGGPTPAAAGATPGFGATPGRFGETPGRFGETPGRFGETPGRFGETPGRFGETPGRFGETPGRFGETPGRFGETPGRFGETPGRFGETPGRFGETPGRFGETPGGGDKFGATPGGNDKFGATPGRFGETPGDKFGATPGRFDATPTPGRSRWDATPKGDAAAAANRRNRWDETPTPARVGETPGHKWDATPTGKDGQTPATAARGGGKRSRWDETPAPPGATPMAGATPRMTPSMTPHGAMGVATPSPHGAPMSGEAMVAMRHEREIEARNRPMTDEELDGMFPSEGYKILEPPASYVPIRTPARKLLATPTPYGGTPGFHLVDKTPSADAYGVELNAGGDGSLPFIKPEDYQYFSKLMDEKTEEDLSPEEAKERKVMRLLLKIKNGTPPQRKTALRQLTDKARLFGAGLLFNQILPLLMAPTLEDQERHLLVKVIDRILYKLDELVRPYVHKILVVIEPLLIDEDYYARVEGREIISNLAKAAGLATMIATMRPDIDNLDEYVRNTTARAFAVVASALGIPALLPFLKAVCQSRTSWQARHTGIKIVQQIAILMGCAVLPHLKHLVEIIEHGLVDDQQKVRTITALALAALAEAAHPYGIESFDSVLRPLWKGIRQHRGKGLAAFLKAIGFIIPLMDSNYANYYTREVMVILIREFQSPDEEMKKIVLKVVKQCVSTNGVDVQYVIDEILPEFFRHFWVRRMALDRRNYRQLVETTVELSNKVGLVPIISRIVDDLKDESEPYRRMVMDTIEKVCQNLGAGDIDARLEEQLIDGILYAFQEQTSDDTIVMLKGFGTVVNALGVRAKPYLPQICGTIKWRLNNKAAKVRMQAADLIARIAVVMMTCEEDKLLGHLGIVLYEYLGEEYPEVLGSILGAIKAIVNVIGMTNMQPPIKDLLPRLTPILKNRHEKVQENCIDLVGRIADRGAEHVGPKEWMRICFELLEMLKAHKKAIRRATVNTFGYIAKAIGPQDVLHTLLNNLKVQARQNRVCTTVAIAIVAETCSPFTVLPALMNEYRVPELNVQNGVLKALSFMFEYIGEMGKDYIYAVSPLLEDALMDRDLVHRQTASTTVKHIALGVAGLGCEDALIHLLNFVFPNLFETSPHVIGAVFAAIEACRISVGTPRILCYILQGLFHPARRVREVYWQIYNNTYVYSQDQLVACYPRLEDDGVNTYTRSYLDMMI